MMSWNCRKALAAAFGEAREGLIVPRRTWRLKYWDKLLIISQGLVIDECCLKRLMNLYATGRTFHISHGFFLRNSYIANTLCKGGEG